MAGVLMVFRVSPILLNVLLAWMSWVMADFNFWLMVAVTFAMGTFLFMLPPVPGLLSSVKPSSIPTFSPELDQGRQTLGQYSLRIPSMHRRPVPLSSLTLAGFKLAIDPVVCHRSVLH